MDHHLSVCPRTKKGAPTFAAYSIVITSELAKVLQRFVTSNRYQLAAQVVNLHFWDEELAHCLGVLDGYNARFERLSRAQEAYVDKHQTVEFSLDDPWGESTQPVQRPTRISSHQRDEARRTVCEAYYRFLVRCFNEGFLDRAQLASFAARHDIGIEQRDLKRDDSEGNR